MSEEKRYGKPFSHPRWHEPIGGEVVGYKPLAPEEKKKAHEDTITVAKSMGLKIKGEPEPDPRGMNERTKNVPKKSVERNIL